MARLLLDPLCVISAWEQMGGSAFSDDNLHLDDPAAFSLDLSGWEARLKPVSAEPAPRQLGVNMFAPFFTPTDLGFGFLPGSCCQGPAAAADAPLATSDCTAQVVPLCPAAASGTESEMEADCGDVSARGLLPDGDLFGGDVSHFDGDGAMSLHFSSDMDAVMSASPTSSEAGVVPDLQGSPSVNPGAQPYSHGSTATSQLGPAGPEAAAAAQAAATAAAAAARSVPFPCLAPPGAGLPGPFFVPVAGAELAGTNTLGCQLPLGSSQWCTEPSLSGGAGAATITIKQEDTPAAEKGPSRQPTPPAQPAPSACEVHMAAQAPHGLPRNSSFPGPQHVLQQPKASSCQPAQHQQQTRAAPVSAQGQGQGSTVPHIRTRAECLERYRQKKARRLYTKKIRYQLRKINADKRPRIKGRFVKKEELEEFLAAQKGSGRAGRDEGEEVYLGEGVFDSDEE